MVQECDNCRKPVPVTSDERIPSDWLVRSCPYTGVIIQLACCHSCVKALVGKEPEDSNPVFRA